MALFQVFLVLVLAIQCPKVKAGCKKRANYQCTEHQLLHNECPDQFIPPSKHESLCDQGADDIPSDSLTSDEGWNFAVRGEPGVDFPNLKEIPRTSFSCRDQKYVPGFYADVETGCQVFHVCYEHRQESFLCPEGTIFSQPLLTCDYWYSADCSRAASYYDDNAKLEQQPTEDDAKDKISDEEELLDGMLSSIIDSLLKEVKISEEKPIVVPTEEMKETKMKKEITELPVVPPQGFDLKPFISSLLKSPVVVPVKPKPVIAPVVVPVKPKPVIAPVVVPVKPKPVIAPVVVPVKPVITPVATAIKSKPIVKAKVMSKAKVNLFKSFVPVKAKVVSYPVLKLPLKMAAAQKPLAVPMKSKLAAKPLLVHHVAAKTQMAISPLTKKLLAASYLKLLKIHKLKSALWGLKG